MMVEFDSSATWPVAPAANPQHELPDKDEVGKVGT